MSDPQIDPAIYTAMIGVEDWIDYPPHRLTDEMPEMIVEALNKAGYVIISKEEYERLKRREGPSL